MIGRFARWLRPPPSPPAGAYIFLDLETTGLNSLQDEITEAAWVLPDGTERQFFVEHRVTPSAWVLVHTDYELRIAPAAKVPFSTVAAALAHDCASNGTTHLVGACPAFDDRFLRAAYANSVSDDGLHRFLLADTVPYHFHVIDIEAVAMGAFGWPVPRSLRELRAAVNLAGANPAPHTALSDAREVKVIWDALRARRRAS